MVSSKFSKKNSESDIDHLSRIIKLDKIFDINSFYEEVNNVIQRISKKKMPTKDDRISIRVINTIQSVKSFLILNSAQCDLIFQWFNENKEKEFHRKIIKTYLPNYTGFQLEQIVKLPKPPMELLKVLTLKELQNIYRCYSKSNSNFNIFVAVLKDLIDMTQEDLTKDTNKSSKGRIARNIVKINNGKLRTNSVNCASNVNITGKEKKSKIKANEREKQSALEKDLFGSDEDEEACNFEEQEEEETVFKGEGNTVYSTNTQEAIMSSNNVKEHVHQSSNIRVPNIPCNTQQTTYMYESEQSDIRFQSLDDTYRWEKGKRKQSDDDDDDDDEYITSTRLCKLQKTQIKLKTGALAVYSLPNKAVLGFENVEIVEISSDTDSSDDI